MVWGLSRYFAFIFGLCIFSPAVSSLPASLSCSPLLTAVASRSTDVPRGQFLLSEIDRNESPWLNLEWEQRHYYLGSTPRELALGIGVTSAAVLPSRLQMLGQTELLRIARQLSLGEVQFEIWPNYDVWGAVTWVIARYRKSELHEWKWLDSSFYPPILSDGPADPTQILLPEFLDPKKKKDAERLFENLPAELYQRPKFGNSVWITPDQGKILAAWLPPTGMSHYRVDLENSGAIAISLPPPARLNGKPVTFVVGVRNGTVEWPEILQWKSEEHQRPSPIGPEKSIVVWPSDFEKEYLADVKRFSGQIPIVSPLTNRTINFEKLGSGQKDNQILDLIAFLKKDYEGMGYGRNPRFTIEEQFFNWIGIRQANLILKVRGYLPPGENRPILLSDHIDKAIAEDVYEKTGVRVTNPGADDNATATAALRQAARLLTSLFKDNPSPHDIWIVHFTGEEFPASDLGARHLVSELLKAKQNIGGNIDFDMLGHRTPGDRLFQINPGFSPGSWRMARVALASARAQGNYWTPVVRYPWSKRSYITQTDSTIFDWVGYDTLLINEHLNLFRRRNPRYHQSTDLTIDVRYAVFQAKTGIEAAIRLALMAHTE